MSLEPTSSSIEYDSGSAERQHPVQRPGPFLPLQLSLLCFCILRPTRQDTRTGQVVGRHQRLCGSQALPDHDVAVLPVILGGDLYVLLGDVQEKGSVVVDDLCKPQRPGLVDCA